MKIYKFYSVINLAETWRDEDHLKYSDEAYFTSFESMEKYVLEFLKYKWSNSQEIPKRVELNESGKWHYDIFGSWMPTYYVEEIKIDQEPNFAEKEKGKQEFKNWAKELKMI